MADMGIPHTLLRRVIGAARVYPIRVGNTPDGYSGGAYPDQAEIRWQDIGQVPETTTVTGRIRRVFTFSRQQMHDAIWACQPNEVFLNFCNYDPELSKVLTSEIDGMLCGMVPGGGSVRYTGWGPTINDIRERSMRNPCDYTREEHILGWVK
jgi:adenylosuccinate synthase